MHPSRVVLRARTARKSAPQSEEVVAYLRARIALFAKITFCLSGAFFVLVTAMSGLGPKGWPGLVHPSHGAHAGTTALIGLLWLVARRVRLTGDALALLDAGTLTVLGCGFAIMGHYLPRDPGMQFPMILAMTHIAIARSVVVPSSALRTAVVTSIASVPVAVSAWLIGREITPLLTHADLAPFMQSAGITWSALTVASATITSRVIYGLQQKVDEAMRLGQYTLGERIGEGGMGVVYRAHHAMLRRPTAIKLLRPEEAGEDSLARFEREVQLTARLTHPNTVAIFDYGRTPDDVFYYAMEYLDGITLEELVALDGPQPPGRVLHILRQMCGALAEAHGIGLIHRDVKPANVILCERGGMHDVIKVVDFGLVKDLSGDAAMSQANTLAGTPLYLSPEAIRNPGTVDARSDLYAVGAVGYYLLTGKQVFDAATVIEVCGHHLHTTPVAPSERLGAPLPDNLESLLLQCLEKDADARPRDARKLSSALGECGDAGRWGETEALAWWEEHRRSKRSRPPVDPLGKTQARQETAASVTIDLTRRAAG